MAWYFAVGTEQHGPLTDDEFQGRVADGTVTEDTLVWRDGMADWVPYRSIAFGSTPSATPVESYAEPQPGQVICSVCGRSFHEEDVIRYEGALVCGECKPVFFQNLKEGNLLSTGMNYAGFWIRFGAKIIDFILVGSVNMVIGFVFGLLIAMLASSGSDAGQLGAVLLQVFLYLFGFALQLAYNTYFLGTFGATPGKMVCGLKVVTDDGRPITYMRALGRTAAEFISQICCYIGYIIAGFDDQKRSLHDHLATTRVVYK
ncbi:MAG: hypothetical protein AMXMBFR84_50450 [Candidatus Hydrogenedentota bacterium]